MFMHTSKEDVTVDIEVESDRDEKLGHIRKSTTPINVTEKCTHTHTHIHVRVVCTVG